MQYLFSAAGAVLVFFIIFIVRKQNKVTADYLLIGINICMGLFLLSEVLVQWKMTSATIIFQNAVPLLLFPVFVLYVLQFTHAYKRISLIWTGIFLPMTGLVTWSIIDHYVLDNYPTQVDVVRHFNEPSLAYQFFFKGSQLLFIALLSWLLVELGRFGKGLKSSFSDLEAIEVSWLRNFIWVYLGSIVLSFVLFLSQNLGILPFQIKEVFGIVYGLLVVAIFYMNYQGINHYTLTQVGGSPARQELPEGTGVDSIASTDSQPLSERERQIEKAMLSLIESEKLYLSPKFSLRDLSDQLNESTHTISRIINSAENR
jgi:hypothetical protein